MTGIRARHALNLCVIAFAAMIEPAGATCSINGTGMTISPSSASTGTYTAPTAPAAQSGSIVVSGTYNTDFAGGTCNIAISFQRGSYPPATMSTTGGATLPYTIQTSAGGGNTLLFTGGTVGSSNYEQYSFASAGIFQFNHAFSATLPVYYLMQPGSPQAAGSYSDTLTLYFFDLSTGYSVGSRSFTVTGTVSKACTIGGVATPAADSATIPITAGGAVNTAVINKSYSSVACNAPANVQLTSQSGAVTIASSPPSGFTNMINYNATATFSGASASLNTATNPLASGAESGTAVSTSGSTPSGTMSVSITPQANSASLVAGTYSDVLTISIIPQ